MQPANPHPGTPTAAPPANPSRRRQVSNSILWFAFLKAMYRATLGRWIAGKITFKVTAKGLQRIADLPLRCQGLGAAAGALLAHLSSCVCLREPARASRIPVLILWPCTAFWGLQAAQFTLNSTHLRPPTHPPLRRDVWVSTLFLLASLVCLIFGLVHFFRGPLDTPLAISLIFMVYNIIPQYLLLQASAGHGTQVAPACQCGMLAGARRKTALSAPPSMACHAWPRHMPVPKDWGWAGLGAGCPVICFPRCSCNHRLQYTLYRKPLVFNALCKVMMVLSTAVLILGVVLVWLLYPRTYDYKQAGTGGGARVFRWTQVSGRSLRETLANRLFLLAPVPPPPTHPCAAPRPWAAPCSSSTPRGRGTCRSPTRCAPSGGRHCSRCRGVPGQPCAVAVMYSSPPCAHCLPACLAVQVPWRGNAFVADYNTTVTLASSLPNDTSLGLGLGSVRKVPGGLREIETRNLGSGCCLGHAGCWAELLCKPAARSSTGALLPDASLLQVYPTSCPPRTPPPWPAAGPAGRLWRPLWRAPPTAGRSLCRGPLWGRRRGRQPLAGGPLWGRRPHRCRLL